LLSGNITGDGDYLHGENVTLNAIPVEGYTFINWTENEIIVSTLEDYIFIVDRNRDLVANFDLLSSIERLDNADIIPENYYLSNAYPNPFNPETNIQFGLPEASEVNISVFDIRGQLIKRIISHVYLPAGNYKTKFTANGIASGIYFYRIFTNSLNSDKHFAKVGKFVLVK